MEMSQGNSLYNYLKQQQQKSLFFLLKNWKTGERTGPVWEVVPVKEVGCGQRVQEGEYGTNTMYTCM
jgi:hypothetical protein